MSRRRHELVLSEAERLTLEQMRDRHAKAYVRVKAAVLLRIAAGEPAYLVAARGVLKPIHRETVYIWLDRFERFGICSLRRSATRAAHFPLRGGKGSKDCFGSSRLRPKPILSRPPDGR